MNLLPVQPSVRFAATLRFVSGRRFKEYTKNPVPTADYPWDLTQIVTYQDAPNVCTQKAQVCTAGGFQEKDGAPLRKFLLFHLSPQYILKNETLIRATFKAELEEWKSQRKALAGLLLGGNVTRDYSRQAFEVLRNLFQELKVMPSIIWGQQTPGDTQMEWYHGKGLSDAYYSSERDLWVLHATDAKGQGILSEKALKKHFEIVEIAPGDTLEFSK